MTSPVITEKQFQEQVIQYARLKGWLCYHTHDARRSEPGFPDLCLVKSGKPGEGKLIFAELKSIHGKVSPDQVKWIAALKSAGVRCFVWRPTDESWESIKEVLG